MKTYQDCLDCVHQKQILSRKSRRKKYTKFVVLSKMIFSGQNTDDLRDLEEVTDIK